MLINLEHMPNLRTEMHPARKAWLIYELRISLRRACGTTSESVYAENSPYIICAMTTYLTHERHGEKAITKISAAAFRMLDRLVPRLPCYPGSFRPAIVPSSEGRMLRFR